MYCHILRVRAIPTYRVYRLYDICGQVMTEDQKKSQYSVEHGNRKQCQCNAKHEGGMRALADD